jgi:hypothetical protein
MNKDKYLIISDLQNDWKDGRVVECGGLENR